MSNHDDHRPALDRPDGAAPAKTRRHRSPLTDLRSLAGSTAFHILVLVLASATVLTVSLPDREGGWRTLKGELGPVDNRAQPAEGGGAPGDLGGRGETPIDKAKGGSTEVLSPKAKADLPRWLRPPGAKGVGVLAGEGTGGGGGSGGGSGGGQGGGLGNGTEFFGAKETAKSFAYVIDRSGSMENRDSLGIAKRELLMSLDQLAEDCRFAVILYDTRNILFAEDGKLMPATTQNKARLQSMLEKIGVGGGTDHKIALLAALAMKPEVIFFLTDADLMNDIDAEEIRRSAGSTRIQAIEFGVGPDLVESPPLKKLATATGGSYRYIDVTTFR